MKTVLVLLATIYVVYVTSETCNELSFNKYTDCPSEVCGINMEKACQRGICTCIVSDDHACLSQSDCLTFNGFATNCTGLNYHNHPKQWHCLDNFCHCSASHGQHGQ